MIRRFFWIQLSVCVLLSGWGFQAAGASDFVSETSQAGDFALVTKDAAATVYVDADDHAVVNHAARLLTEDVERVTGRKPQLSHQAEDLSGPAVLIGTLGQSEVIDRLVETGKIDVEAIKGQWESHVIQTVDQPLPGVEKGLVIVGSDRRGTAYGVFELSEQIGVSPWYWWADVAPDPKEALYVKDGTYQQGPPDVKYRGIFINDEDWGLEPWNRLTFDPGNDDVGPKAYAKIFELILRLRGNHLWPAMHHVTNEFAAVPGNVELADEWAIVMGSAHSEPMLRNNVWWRRDGQGEWNYLTNKENVLAYWEEWAQKRGEFENIWTVGMRGIHDTEMEGPNTPEEQAKVLEQVIRDQRGLLEEHANDDVTQVPQVFTPYKEALAQYQAGLDLPEDVTIMWAEDNYGYIRQLSTPEEQQRAGGSGVYYHISYLGWPRPYLWINTTPPALIWEEMSKAYEQGADRVWILNVGDIKPGEIGIEFWHRMAWDVDRYGPDAQMTFLREWATRDFGPEHADEIAKVMDEFYRLAFIRKPELMEDDLFSLVHYREAERYLENYREIMAQANSLYERMPAHKRDAFYQLVVYPVRIGSLVAEAFINADFSRLYAQQGRVVANDFARRSEAAVDRVHAETAYYNNILADGKWRNMMFTKGIGGGWNLDWPTVSRVEPNANPGFGVALQGRGEPLLPEALRSAMEGIEINLSAEEGEIEAPMQVKRDGEITYVVVPNDEEDPGSTAGNTLTPGGGAKASYKFTVPQDGTYNLFMLVNTPTNKDDSWFIRIDDGEWQSWNDIGARRPWDWRKQGSYELKKGRHTLTIANREDGSMFSRIRLTPRNTPQKLGEKFADSGPADTLPPFNRFTNTRQFIDLYNTGGEPFEWTAQVSHPWIQLARTRGTVNDQQRLWVEVDWSAIPEGEEVAGTIRLSGAGSEHAVTVNVAGANASAVTEGVYLETDGYVSIQAEHPARNRAAGEVEWTPIAGLGRTGEGAIAPLPTTFESAWPLGETPESLSQALADMPAMEYDVVLDSAGEVELTLYTLPTHRLYEGRGLRYAVAFDDGEPQVVDFYESGGHGGEDSPTWRLNVSRNAAISTSTHTIEAPGKHTLKLWAIDPSVVVDKLVIDAGGLKESYLGPRETRVATEQ